MLVYSTQILIEYSYKQLIIQTLKDPLQNYKDH